MDFLQDYIEHSWGKKPEQKQREKEYNAEYYRKHKEKWADNANKIGAYRIYDQGEYKRKEYVDNDGRDLKKELDYLKWAAQEHMTTDKYKHLPQWIRDGMFDVRMEMLGIKQYNQKTANRRINASAAANERDKAYNNAIKQRDRYLDKQQEAEYDKAHPVKAVIKNGKKMINNIFKKLGI